MPQSRIDFSKIINRKLEPSDDLSAFNCDIDDELGCNGFIHKEDEAKLFQKERQGITYLFFYEKTMVGYVTIATSSILAKRVDKRYHDPVRLTFYPSLLIGRLAVDNNWRRKRIGKYLCAWCIGFAVELSEKVGCRYVVVQTSENKIDFYSKSNFLKAQVVKEEKDKLIWMYQRIAFE